MTNPHNDAFHKVMIWQEKGKCKHYTDKHWEEKHLDVHCLLPVERVWELGDFNSWTGLILETTSHSYKKGKAHIYYASLIQWGKLVVIFPGLSENKGIELETQGRFSSLFILSLPGHTFSLHDSKFLAFNFLSYIHFLPRFWKSWLDSGFTTDRSLTLSLSFLFWK